MLVNSKNLVLSIAFPAKCGAFLSRQILPTIFAICALLVVAFAPNRLMAETNSYTAESPLTIIAFGDSLTAGYGLEQGKGFVPQLETWLKEHSHAPVKLVNAGVSGDTTAGGRSRLMWTLSPNSQNKPDLVILTLGGNDGLRGINPKLTRENMDAMLKSLSEQNIKVLVGGMMAPPNLGPDYAAEFNGLYRELTQKYNVPLYPFFLDGVAADPRLNQNDGIHPNADGVAVIVSKIGPVILKVLDASGGVVTSP